MFVPSFCLCLALFPTVFREWQVVKNQMMMARLLIQSYVIRLFLGALRKVDKQDRSALAWLLGLCPLEGTRHQVVPLAVS